MIRNVLVACAVLSLCLSPTANAQTRTQQLADCLLQNASGEDEKLMKDLLIKALQDAPADDLQASAMALGFSIYNLGTSFCEMTPQEVSSGVFEQAAEIYGEALGEKIVTDAFSKIG